MHKELNISNLKHIYFLGIGGIGMSALARYFNLFGKQVSGYDRTPTPLTQALETEGMEIHYSEDPSKIDSDIDLVVYTPAIPSSHLEWNRLKELGVPILKRAEVLGLISRSMKTIAIAGTHGKTSTSSMVTQVLRSSGLDATGFMGGIVKNFASNFVYGESDWVVVEADEFDRSFLHLEPEIAVLLSMDADHLDIYGTHQEMLKAFRAFTMNIVDGGSLLIHASITGLIDKDWRMDLLSKSISLFSFNSEGAWFHASNIKSIDHRFEFDFNVGQQTLLETALQMPGDHNVSNATAALGIGALLGLDPDKMGVGLKEFKGIKRRFDYIVQSPNVIYIDDYAHHPSEIHAAIGAAKKLYPNKKLTVVFQPHLFTRTRDFLEGFAEELVLADELVLMPIYPARELPIPGVTTDRIAELMDREVSILNEEEVVRFVETLQPEVLLTLGAGNIDRLVPRLKEVLTN